MVDDVKWDMVPLGLVAEFHTGWTPPSGDDRYYGGSHKWANISDVGTRHLYDTERTISDFALEKQPGARLALPGDLLFPFKLSIGAVSFACEEMYTNEAIAVFPPNDKFDLRFAYYAFPYFLLKNAGVNIYGAPLLNSTLIKQARVPSPPLETQQRIADYLDRETAEIDAAVADLDTHVELLEKRRLETITSAVEGSSGPGKDKLGSEEFFKPKLGYVVLDIRTGLNPRKNFELDTPDAENWYVTVRELDGASIRTSEATSKINDQALELIQKRARIKVGDVLFSGTGTIGNTALVSLPPINWGVKEGIYILTPDVSRMRSDFLLWILRSRKILSLADEMSDGSTVKSIPIEKLKRVPIPLPSLSVQKLIVDYLDRETTEIDDLIEESTKLRDLLLKRRSVLITEVVTGRKQV